MADGVLQSEEAARRLGVRLPTLYAYVSRGLLQSRPAPDGRRSLFDAAEVEALARRSRGGRRTETRLATVTTATTQLGEDGPRYRGTPAVALAGEPYEDVAELLWRAEEPAPRPWPPSVAAPPPGLATADRLRWAALAGGAADPLRADLRPDAVRSAARRLCATVVAATGPGGPGPAPMLELAGSTVAESVAGRLSARLADAPSPALVRAVNAALVLLADHELAASTLAVRVAASTRADLYDAALAGMAVMGGPLHGGASSLAYDFLRRAGTSGAAAAVHDELRWGRRLPGFGHAVYRAADPRFVVLRDSLGEVVPGALLRTLDDLVGLAAEGGLPAPNVDLALGALALGAGMAADAGQTVFTVARVAGWTAHYLEELQERPLRYRVRAVYAQRD